MSNIQEDIKKVLLEVKPEVEKNLDSKELISQGLLDSLDIMNLVIALEIAFDIEIDPEDVMSNNFESVEAIEKLIEKCKE